MFGITKTKSQKQVAKAAKVYWGELKVEYEQEEESEEEEEEESNEEEEVPKMRAIGGVEEQVLILEF